MAWIQGNGATGFGTQIQVSFLGDNTAGNLVLAGLNAATTLGSETVTDSRNTFTRDAGVVSNGDSGGSAWAAPNCGAGSNTVTASGGGSISRGLVIGEWSEVKTTSPFHNATSGTGFSTSPNSGSMATSVPDVLLIGFAASGNGAASPFTAGTNYTARVDSGGGQNRPTFFEDRVVSATGAYNATATQAGTSNWTMFVLAYELVTTTFEQEGFRWRDDDGSESAASWLDAQDANITRQADTPTRLRVLVDTGTGDPSTTQFQLECKLSTDSTWDKVPTGTTITRSVDAAITTGSDDAQQIGTTMTLTGNTLGGSLDAVTDWVGLRFGGIQIPQGATITSAYISVVPSGTGEDEPNVDIYFEDGDDPGTFTTGASDISNRSRTSAVSWSSTNLGASGSSYHDSPDLSAILQTVVNRGGWAPGNALVVIIQGGSTGTRDLTIESFENGGGNPPRLHVEYAAPAPIQMAASANIGASGEHTTAQLTPPAGKSTSDFGAGRIQDDENPADGVDVALDEYTELEWCITAASAQGATAGQVYEFRVTKAGSAFDTYSVTPQWTIGSGGGGGTTYDDTLSLDAGVGVTPASQAVLGGALALAVQASDQGGSQAQVAGEIALDALAAVSPAVAAVIQVVQALTAAAGLAPSDRAVMVAAPPSRRAPASRR